MTFTQGLRTFFEGLRAARAPGLRRYTWLPALVSLAIVAAGLYLTLHYAGVLTTWLTTLLPDWLQFLGVVLTPVLYLLALLAGTWLFALLAVLIASPFLGDLSIAVEARTFGDGPPQPGSVWTGVIASLAREARKLTYHLPRLLGVFVVSLIPGINAIAPVVWFLFGAWTMAVQFTDYPVENRHRPFRDTVELLGRHRLAALGFGAVAAALLAIPVINFLFIPAAVAGGTLLWRRLQEAEGRPGTG